MTKERYSTQEVADLARVHKDTLLRWLRQGKVDEPARDFRGWRVFSRREALEIAALARGLHDPRTGQSVPEDQLGFQLNG